MQRVSKFSARWLSNYGMSIGIGDVTPAPLLIQKKKELL
jgi:DNA-directed RNA polymerase III subunit RPC1